mmetsp:Transcript_38559/g.102545  ORF Transcript_38559/g.102545 Transcript_38559/m.102545 type:complete len:284 (+) Transcript_38559:554-1405(+)
MISSQHNLLEGFLHRRHRCWRRLSLQSAGGPSSTNTTSNHTVWTWTKEMTMEKSLGRSPAQMRHPRKLHLAVSLRRKVSCGLFRRNAQWRSRKDILTTARRASTTRQGKKLKLKMKKGKMERRRSMTMQKTMARRLKTRRGTVWKRKKKEKKKKSTSMRTVLRRRRAPMRKRKRKRKRARVRTRTRRMRMRSMRSMRRMRSMKGTKKRRRRRSVSVRSRVRRRRKAERKRSRRRTLMQWMTRARTPSQKRSLTIVSSKTTRVRRKTCHPMGRVLGGRPVLPML